MIRKPPCSKPFIDEAENAVFELGKTYGEIHFINCNGKFGGNKATINYIEPFRLNDVSIKSPTTNNAFVVGDVNNE